jgi:hypoxanthine-DNA glycosylase
MHHRSRHPNSLYGTGLRPVIGRDPALLILGSFPSRTSLERGQYYANPHNQFWQIIESLLAIDRDLAYEQRIEQLIRNRIALWDVISTCRRRGSADHQIRDPSLNAVRDLLASNPAISAVAFNGTTASRYAPVLRLPGHVVQVTLPSTSPANTRFTCAEKTGSWGILLEILNSVQK